MARPRSFDTDEVLTAAREAFVRSGYAGTSVDDLLTATGIQRASLYQAFGSKRGIFLAALRRGNKPDLPMLLVALMDLAGHDEEVRALAAAALDGLGSDACARLGHAVIVRAGLTDTTLEGRR